MQALNASAWDVEAGNGKLNIIVSYIASLRPAWLEGFQFSKE